MSPSKLHLSRTGVDPSVKVSNVTATDLKRTRFSTRSGPLALHGTLGGQLNDGGLNGKGNVLVAVSRARTTSRSSLITVTATIRRIVASTSRDSAPSRSGGNITVMFTNLPCVIGSLLSGRMAAFLHHTLHHRLSGIPLPSIGGTFLRAITSSNGAVDKRSTLRTTHRSRKCPCVIRLINCCV